MGWKVTARSVNPVRTAYDTLEHETLEEAMKDFVRVLKEVMAAEEECGNVSMRSEHMIQTVINWFEGADDELTDHITTLDGYAVLAHTQVVTLHI